MKISKKTAIRAILCVLALFILINIGWYVWRMEKYGSYSKDMEENYISRIVPRYKHTDEDGFDYGVKYPDYLSFTGNLSVGLPATDENIFTDCLIIWPKLYGGYEYGVILNAGEEDYQIYINEDGSAVYPEDSEVVIRYQKNINTLLSKAEEMWDLE